jgi:methylenetetrahydrofolate dehydrogenase (NADP+)/methenyltetrahydrofolate cyclohydrolase
MTLIDGKKTAETIQLEIAAEVKTIREAGGKIPHLAAILVGNDGGSETYVASKVKTCEKVGFKSSLIRLPVSVTEKELLEKIEGLNKDADVDGFIIQLPLPKHISEQKIIESVSPEKDVDGFHPSSVGRMVLNLDTYIWANPFVII